jgi:hypothetical protein
MRVFHLAAAQVLVGFALLVVGFADGPALSQVPKQAAHFVGSESCKSCHANAYDGWKQTPMANVVRDPKIHTLKLSSVIFVVVVREAVRQPFDRVVVPELRVEVGRRRTVVGRYV